MSYNRDRNRSNSNRSFNRSGNNRSFNRSGNRGTRSSFGQRAPRELHKVTCSKCGKETEVPFKPDGERPVYCKECYDEQKPRRY